MIPPFFKKSTPISPTPPFLWKIIGTPPFFRKFRKLNPSPQLCHVSSIYVLPYVRPAVIFQCCKPLIIVLSSNSITSRDNLLADIDVLRIKDPSQIPSRTTSVYIQGWKIFPEVRLILTEFLMTNFSPCFISILK